MRLEIHCKLVLCRVVLYMMIHLFYTIAYSQLASRTDLKKIKKIYLMNDNLQRNYCPVLCIPNMLNKPNLPFKWYLLILVYQVSNSEKETSLTGYMSAESQQQCHLHIVHSQSQNPRIIGNLNRVPDLDYCMQRIWSLFVVESITKKP